ncbi:MAG: metal ABC transporter ATP-binding protein, partial [Acidimicrobiia bacterium]
MTTPLVVARAVTVGYGRVPALEDVDFCVNKDDFVGVVGPSGCGKTTLLRLIVGAVSPKAGVIERRRGLRVGYVPQVGAVNLSFPLTVAECVLMGMRRRRLAPWATTREREEVDAVLARIGLCGLQGRSIGALSGGQQQRVFLARALVDNPEVVLLDEPTSGVDVRTRHEVLHLLDEIHTSGVAVI